MLDKNVLQIKTDYNQLKIDSIGASRLCNSDCSMYLAARRPKSVDRDRHYENTSQTITPSIWISLENDHDCDTTPKKAKDNSDLSDMTPNKPKNIYSLSNALSKLIKYNSNNKPY